MKFGKQFEFHKIPEWSEFYLDYNLLKNLIKEYSKVARKTIKDRRKKSFKGLPTISKSEEIDRQFIEDKPILKKPLLRKSHSLKVTPSFPNPSEDISLKSEEDLKNSHSDELMGSEIKVQISIDEAWKNDELVEMLSDWTKKFEQLIHKINRFFKSKSLQYENDFQNLTNVLNEKIENRNRTFTSVSKEENLKRSMAEIKKAKETDELGYAVSWRRAFSQLYSNVSWLHSYCTINYIATQKILKKFIKKFKGVPQAEKFHEKLLNFIKQKTFVVKDSDIVALRRDIALFYSERFTDGKVEKANNELAERMIPISQKDIALIFFFIGFILALLFSNFWLYICDSGDQTHSIVSFLPCFSFTFMLIACFFGIGINIQIFRKYRVNYIYIFEIDPKTRLSQEKIYRVALFLLSLWCLLLIIIYTSVQYQLLENSVNFTLSMMILVFMFLFLIWPFHCFYLTLRKAIFLTLFNNLFPIGRSAVKFRDFMFGDVLTSLTRPFQNLYFTICYSTCIKCIHELDYTSECKKNDYTPLFLTLLPYIIRFFQCLNRYYYTKNAWPHLANALKYLGGITNSFFIWDIVALHNNSLVISVGVIATGYLIFWDIKMDWDLGHISSRNFFLRDKLMYPKPFYYWVLISNFLLRFTWLYNIYIPTHGLLGEQTKMFIFSFLEVFRRIQWSFFRVENENQNNFEKYRTILDIPELPSH